MADSRIISDRYHRQEKLIPGWRQQDIRDTRAIVIGSGRLSDMLLADLSAIGIGELKRIGYSSFFEFEKINPDVYIEQTNERLSNYPQADVLISDADMVIDATNSKQSKYYSAGIARSKGMAYLSISASHSGFSYFPLPHMAPEKSLDELLKHHEKELTNDDSDQGLINSIACSAIATDEIRKKIFSLKDDMVMGCYQNSDIDESANPLGGKKVLQVGAGAIGTFTGLALASTGAGITIVDFDVVEESNLNRQFLFYDDVGRPKAEALADKLKRYSSDVDFKVEKIKADFCPVFCVPGRLDAMFSCVDNNMARYFMNHAAGFCGLTLINGGSSLNAGASMPYSPKNTACLDCQSGGKLSEPVNNVPDRSMGVSVKRAPGECFQPSLIISNQIVAAMMMNAWMKAMSGNFERSDYMSGFGMFNQKIADRCVDGCMTSLGTYIG